MSPKDLSLPKTNITSNSSHQKHCSGYITIQGKVKEKLEDWLASKED